MVGAVGSKVLDYMKRHELFKNVQNLSGHLMDQLQPLYEHSIVGDIRGKGFMIGIEFVKDQKTKRTL